MIATTAANADTASTAANATTAAIAATAAIERLQQLQHHATKECATNHHKQGGVQVYQ